MFQQYDLGALTRQLVFRVAQVSHRRLLVTQLSSFHPVLLRQQEASMGGQRCLLECTVFQREPATYVLAVSELLMLPVVARGVLEQAGGGHTGSSSASAHTISVEWSHAPRGYPLSVQTKQVALVHSHLAGRR